MSAPLYFSVVKIGLQAGKAEAYVKNVVHSLAENTRKEPGCKDYFSLQGVDNENDMVSVAAWDSKESHRKHRLSPHVHRARKEIPDSVQDIETVRVHEFMPSAKPYGPPQGGEALHVIAYIRVKPDHIKDFREAVQPYVQTVNQNEPGITKFACTQGDEDKELFVFFEEFKTAEDRQKHEQAPHYAEFAKKISAYLAGPLAPHKYKLLAV